MEIVEALFLVTVIVVLLYAAIVAVCVILAP